MSDTAVTWDNVRAAISSFIVACKVVDPGEAIDGNPADPYAAIFWEREANTVAFGDVIELRISGEKSVGYDDCEDIEVSPGVFVPSVTGIREFVLSIRYNSRSQVTAARKALETIRSSLQHPTRVSILDDASVAFLGTETLQTFDAVSDDRWESIAVLDVRMCVVSELFDPDDPPVGYLESVGVSVNGSAEETLP
jgi:hypothetical protein